MLDLLKMNIFTSKLFADQIIQMNTMIDENFDPEKIRVNYLVNVLNMLIFV